MKLLITGAFGNLGMMCVRQSLAMGYAVRCFDVDNPATRERAAEFSGKVETVFGDIRDKAQLENLVAGVDAIIHNASLLPPMTDLQPQLADAINITATEELIRVAEAQPKKPVLLFPSSISVFGPAQIGRVMTANDPAVASDNYTRHKVTIEKALQASSLPWCILRVGVSVDSRTLKTDRATFTKLIATRADNPLEYVHPCDVALAMCRAVGHPEAVGKILLPIIAMSALVGAMMVFALRRGLRPLDQAARDVAARSAVSLEPMPTEAVPAEVSPLVRAINSLMGKLAESMSVQRRFLADAAHELRTPMTALRLQVQLLERAQDEASRREAAAELEYGVARSAHLIEQLLQVARSGPDGQPVRIEPVDLGELVRSVVGRMSAKAEAKHIDLGAQTGKALRVDGDPQALLVLLNNLVENALRYTPAGGTVDVGAALREGHAVLYVVDDGPGIPEAERPRVFDRFYRGADRAAGAGDGSGGDSGSSVKKVEVKPPATEKVTPPSEAAGVGLKSGSTAPPGAPGAEKPK